MAGPYSDEIHHLDQGELYAFQMDDALNQFSPFDAQPAYQQQHAADGAEQTHQEMDVLDTNIANFGLGISGENGYLPANQEFQGGQAWSYAQSHLPTMPVTEKPATRRSKRLRSGAPKPATSSTTTCPRSTTPDYPPPHHPSIFDPSVLPGTFTSKLAASLSIPSNIPSPELHRRQSTMLSVLFSDTPSPLPPPSPRVKQHSTLTSRSRIYKIRQPPPTVSLRPLLSRGPLIPYVEVAGLPHGAALEAARAYNNGLAKARRLDQQARNNTAAARSRNRKERAIVRRSGMLAEAWAELRHWKARAVGLGAAEWEWEALDAGVKEEMVAGNRVDPWDYSIDESVEERVETRIKVERGQGKKRVKI